MRACFWHASVLSGGTSISACKALPLLAALVHGHKVSRVVQLQACRLDDAGLRLDRTAIWLETSIKTPACIRHTVRQRCSLQSWGGWHADASTTAAPDRHTLNQTPVTGLNQQHANSPASPLHILRLAPRGKCAHVLLYTGCSAIIPLLPKFMPLKRPTSLRAPGTTVRLLSDRSTVEAQTDQKTSATLHT